MNNVDEYLRENGFKRLYVPYKGELLPTKGYYVNPDGIFLQLDDSEMGFHYLPYLPDKDGYNRQGIATSRGNIMCRLSRLVAYMFVPNPDPEKCDVVNHLNLNKTDDRACNLEWTTTMENTKHYNKNHIASTPRKDYPISQCKPIGKKTIQVIRRWDSIRNVPTIGFDGREQKRRYVSACCQYPSRKTYHDYYWFYEQDKAKMEMQGYMVC